MYTPYNFCEPNEIGPDIDQLNDTGKQCPLKIPESRTVPYLHTLVDGLVVGVGSGLRLSGRLNQQDSVRHSLWKNNTKL